MTDLVKLYNPANAASLTPEQLTNLQKLTSAEIKQLAEAYPNASTQRAYLLIIDSTKPPEKQLPTMSTFENLWNLRELNAQRNHVAFGYKGTYKAPANIVKTNKKVEVLDLSETELMDLPGFKTTKSFNTDDGKSTINVGKQSYQLSQVVPEGTDVKVKVTKIKKVKKPKSK